MQATQLLNELIEIAQAELLVRVAHCGIVDFEILDQIGRIDAAQLKKRLDQIAVYNKFTLLNSSIRLEIPPLVVLNFAFNDCKKRFKI